MATDRDGLLADLVRARGRRRNGRMPVDVDMLTSVIDFLSRPLDWSSKSHDVTIIDRVLNDGVHPGDAGTMRLPVGIVLDGDKGLCFGSNDGDNIKITGAYNSGYQLRVDLLCRSITHQDVP